MELKVEDGEHSTLVFLEGKLSFKDHPDFNEFIDSLPKGKKTVIFNVSKLEQIDSAGIGMMFLAQKVVEEKNGGKMVIKNPSGQVLRIFDITSIGEQISIELD